MSLFANILKNIKYYNGDFHLDEIYKKKILMPAIPDKILTLEDGYSCINKKKLACSTKKSYCQGLARFCNHYFFTLDIEKKLSLIIRQPLLLFKPDIIPLKARSLLIIIKALMHVVSESDISESLKDLWSDFSVYIFKLENYKNKSHEITKEQEDTWISYDTLLKIIHSLPIGFARIYMALSLYNPPLRNDYHDMLFINDAVENKSLYKLKKQENYIFVNAILLNNYKTSYKYGAELIIKLTPNANEELTKYLNFLKLDTYQPLFKKKYKTRMGFFGRINRELSRHLNTTINMNTNFLRHVYLTSNISNIVKLSYFERVLLSRYMAHSFDMQNSYVLFKTPKVNDLEKHIKGQLKSAPTANSKYKSFCANLKHILHSTQ